MRSLGVLLAFVFFIPSEPGAGQTLSFGPTFTRTYYGCATGISCHLVSVSWWETAPGQFAGTVRAQSWFGNQWGAGNPMRLIVSSFGFPVWAFSDEYWSRFAVMLPYFDETWALDASADGYPIPNWRPRWVQMQVSYGLPAGGSYQGPYGENITLALTPEPESMILLATGLLGVGFAFSRRKRRAEHSG